jgi:hypothetical protein
LATVLAASAAFIAACDRQACHDEHGQPIACNTGHAGGHVGLFGGSGRGGDEGGVARGGFGGTGGGGEGGGE